MKITKEFAQDFITSFSKETLVGMRVNADGDLILEYTQNRGNQCLVLKREVVAEIMKIGFTTQIPLGCYLP